MVRTLVIFCSIFATACSNQGESVTIVKVGKYSITRSMIEYRGKVSEAFYPKQKAGSSQYEIGKQQLIRFYRFAEIMRLHEREILPVQVEAEAKRIEMFTRDPKKLSQIKAIFENDYSSYLAVFVFPTLVDRVFQHQFFNYHSALHALSKAQAERFLNEATRSGWKVTRDLHLAERYLPGRLIPRLGINWLVDQEVPASADIPEQTRGQNPFVKDALQKFENSQMVASLEEAKRWLSLGLAGLPIGHILPRVIEQPEQWLVIRKTRQNEKEEIWFEAASFPKQDFFAWLSEAEAKIRVDYL